MLQHCFYDIPFVESPCIFSQNFLRQIMMPVSQPSGISLATPPFSTTHNDTTHTHTKLISFNALMVMSFSYHHPFISAIIPFPFYWIFLGTHVKLQIFSSTRWSLYPFATEPLLCLTSEFIGYNTAQVLTNTLDFITCLAIVYILILDFLVSLTQELVESS